MLEKDADVGQKICTFSHSSVGVIFFRTLHKVSTAAVNVDKTVQHFHCFYRKITIFFTFHEQPLFPQPLPSRYVFTKDKCNMLHSPTTTLYDLSERGKCKVRKVRQSPKAFCQCTRRCVYSTSQDGVTFPSTLLSIPLPYRRNSDPHRRGRFTTPQPRDHMTHLDPFFNISARECQE